MDIFELRIYVNDALMIFQRFKGLLLITIIIKLPLTDNTSFVTRNLQLFITLSYPLRIETGYADGFVFCLSLIRSVSQRKLIAVLKWTSGHIAACPHKPIYFHVQLRSHLCGWSRNQQPKWPRLVCRHSSGVDMVQPYA